MAITRVIGRIDGMEVNLERKHGDVWAVPVPMDQDGEYAVEIMAEDEAGNQSYLAKMLFTVNTALLCVHVVQLPFYASLQEPVYSVSVFPRKYELDLTKEKVFLEVQQRDYYAELIEPECRWRKGAG